MSDEFDPYHKWLGIRPDERPIDHYRLLGLSRFEDDPEVIANASDQRMSTLRTFQIGRHSRQSQQLLNEVATARLCLLNQDKKAVYDRSLRDKTAPPTLSPPSPPTAQGSAPPTIVDYRSIPNPLAPLRLEPDVLQRRRKVSNRHMSSGAAGWILVGITSLIAIVVIAALKLAYSERPHQSLASAEQSPAKPKPDIKESTDSKPEPRPALPLQPRREWPRANAPVAAPPTVPVSVMEIPQPVPAAPVELIIPEQPGNARTERFEVPLFVDLPDRGSKEVVDLAAVAPGIARLQISNPVGNPVAFTATHDGEGWHVNKGNLKVASITQRQDKLCFAWESGAPADAECLRNTVLKLVGADYEQSMALRSPLDHGDITIDLSKSPMSLPLKLDLWDLDAKSLIVEVFELSDSPAGTDYLPQDRRGGLDQNVRILLRKQTPLAAIDVELYRANSRNFLKLWPRMIDEAGASRAWSQSSFKKLYRGIEHEIAEAEEYIAAAPSATKALNNEIAIIRGQANNLTRSLAAHEISRLSGEVAEINAGVTARRARLDVLKQQLRLIEPLGHLGNAVHQRAKLKFRVFFVVDGHEVNVLRNS